MGDKVDFLPVYIQGRFLQVDSNTLGMLSQAYPKYPKQQDYNIFAISNGKREG